MTERESTKYFLRAELDAANARNDRLSKENARLREQLERLNGDKRSKSILNVEARLKAFQFEDERDRMYENLEKLKRKYNQLHEAFLLKLKRCRALEEVFSRQKTLTGLVMKSAMQQKETEQKVLPDARESTLMEQPAVEALQNQVKTLQIQLAEAHDIIDEMDFELESMDFLEWDNQRLREEQRSNGSKEDHSLPHGEDIDVLPKYSEVNAAKGETDSVASSLADSFAGDMDAETIERAALTESLIKVAEAESNCLRRELLRSRLRRTTKAARPTSSDA